MGRRWNLLAMGVAAVLAALVHFAAVSYTGYDAKRTLLVSQALLQTGHPRLDAYVGEDGTREYQLIETGGHVYYYFPIGSSLVALPAVAVANVLGDDMSDVSQEANLQRNLATLGVAIVFLLFFWIARRRLPAGWALAVSFAIVAGSSLTSTNGTALWSMATATLCTMVALWVWLGAREHDAPARVWVLAPALLLAYLCRPTAALPGALIVAWITWERPRAGMWLVGSLAMLGAIFLGWMRWEMGQWLPAYFQATRLELPPNGTAMWANLVSPSRGVFVLSPQFLVALPVLVTGWRVVDRRVLLFASAWFALHWLLVSAFPHWWGGHSYGSRLMTEAFVPLGLLSIEAARGARAGKRKLPVLGFAIASFFAFFVHVAQGLGNSATQAWSRYPDVDSHPDRLLDWRQPQWLATAANVEERRIGEEVAALRQIEIDETVYAGTPSVILESWYRPEQVAEGTYAWSKGHQPRIRFLFAPAARASDPDRLVRLTVVLGSRRPQDIEVRLNGQALGTIARDGVAPRSSVFEIPLSALRTRVPRQRPTLETLNDLVFLVSSPAAGDGLWPRESPSIGISFWSLAVSEISGNAAEGTGR